MATSLPDPASAQRDPVGVATRQLGVGSSGRSDPLGNTSQVKRVQGESSGCVECSLVSEHIGMGHDVVACINEIKATAIFTVILAS